MILGDLTSEQRDTLARINEHSEWRDADNRSYDLNAYEDATGDPVIFVYGEEAFYVLRPDGTMEATG